MPRLALLTIVIFMCILPGSALAALLTLEADEIQKSGSRIEAFGNVVVTGEGSILKADYVVYDTESEDVWATGDCSLHETKGEVAASSLYYNARRKDMQLYDGYALVYADTMKISGRYIRRYGEDFYTGDNIQYTTCLGTPPAWSLKAKSMEIPLEGYAKTKDASLDLRDFPLFWTPYLLLPAKLKRQSGILFPEIGHSSDYGLRFGLPVFIVLGRSLDWTFTPTYLSTRGVLLKNELRYALDYERKGLLYAETLHDRMGGEPSKVGVLNEIPKDRWLFKADQVGGNLNWDINLVSNPDYFRDIGTFYNSNYIQGIVTGDVNAFGDSNLEELISRAQWVNSSKWFSVSLSGQWKQNLLTEDNGNTLQQLPRLSVLMREREIPNTPFMVSSRLSSIRIYSTDYIQAFKDNAQVEFSLPIYKYPYFTLRPFIQELYRDTRFSETKGAFPKSTFTEVWQTWGASLSTTLYSKRFGNDLYHQIIPEVTWTHQSRLGGNPDSLDTDDIFPQLLPDDNIEKLSTMNVSIANYIRDNQGSSLADLTVVSTYSYIDETWGSIEARANIQPVSWMSASYTNIFGREPKKSFATQEQSLRVNFKDTRDDTFYFAGDYNRLDTDLIRIGMDAKLAGGFSAGYEVGYDFARHSYDKSKQRVLYNSQCWAIEVVRYVEPSTELLPRKTTWALVIKLLGLGDISGGG
jgi:LPS-assembly protein